MGLEPTTSRSEVGRPAIGLRVHNVEEKGNRVRCNPVSLSELAKLARR